MCGLILSVNCKIRSLATVDKMCWRHFPDSVIVINNLADCRDGLKQDIRFKKVN